MKLKIKWTCIMVYTLPGYIPTMAYVYNHRYCCISYKYIVIWYIIVLLYAPHVFRTQFHTQNDVTVFNTVNTFLESTSHA